MYIENIVESITGSESEAIDKEVKRLLDTQGLTMENFKKCGYRIAIDHSSGITREQCDFAQGKDFSSVIEISLCKVEKNTKIKFIHKVSIQK